MDKKSVALPKLDSIGSGPAEVKDMMEMANMMQQLLQKVQDNFQTMSEQIMGRIDEMDRKIDGLEQDLNELIHKSGIIDESNPGYSQAYINSFADPE